MLQNPGQQGEASRPIVDGYVHCGINKYHPIERVSEVMQDGGVGRAVLVQHLGEYDNSYIERVVARDPERFVGVGLVDHHSSRAEKEIEKLGTAGRFRGVRLTADTLGKAPHLWNLAVEFGLIIVLYAPAGLARIVSPLEEFLAEYPHARIVLTHLGNPDPADSPGFESYQQVFRLARYANIYYQLSGMKMFCLYPHAELHPLIELATRHFEPSRIYWGSNYPVVGDVEDYRRDLRLCLEGILPVARAAIPAIIGGNAHDLWFTNVS